MRLRRRPPQSAGDVSKNEKSAQRPTLRRSTRIQQLAGNSIAPPVFEELALTKRPLRKRKVNAIQPTEPALEPSSRNGLLPVPPLLSWLDNVDPNTGENPQVSTPTDSFEMPEYSSSVIPTLVTGTTQRTMESWVSPQRFQNLLEARHAFPNKSKDSQTERFLSAYRRSRPATFDGTNDLWESISCLNEHKRNSNGNEKEIKQLVEKMTNELQNWRRKLDLATITEEEFNGDIRRCQSAYANEAELQRTLLTEITNRHQLDEMFVVRFEGQWKVPETSALPSLDEDKVPAPKPDCAFSYHRAKAEFSDTVIPQEFVSFLAPEGFKILCFPFLFIETKKQSDSIVPALHKNFHTASQALFNIYKWMEKAGKLGSFFKNVRVLSIAINAERMIVRVHRAEPSTVLPLDFAYDELMSTSPYTITQAWALIKSFLYEYAAQQLCEILKDAFQTVSKLYEKAKRKNADTTSTHPSKKSRSKSKTPSQSSGSTALVD